TLCLFCTSNVETFQSCEQTSQLRCDLSSRLPIVAGTDTTRRSSKGTEMKDYLPRAPRVLRQIPPVRGRWWEDWGRISVDTPPGTA
ncbi:hypothetical protein BaRGS_00036396, partial [Batillaria attramentaria]